jgi:hypothetical protein
VSDSDQFDHDAINSLTRVQSSQFGSR